MQELDFDSELKVIVVGNGGVGKTSMITRFAKGEWTDGYKKTIGTDFMERDFFVRSRGEAVKLMLWDTAGQEMFSELTRSYYRGAGAVVYAFSTTDRDSFLEVERWRTKVEAECGTGIVSVLVQNKVDLMDRAAMTNGEVEDLARRMGVKLHRTCVKENAFVDDVFEYVSETFLARGGQAAAGVAAVPFIGEVGRKSGPDLSAAAAAAADGKGGAGKDGTGPGGQKAFKLEPSKRRTDGKKKGACAIL